MELLELRFEQQSAPELAARPTVPIQELEPHEWVQLLVAVVQRLGPREPRQRAWVAEQRVQPVSEQPLVLLHLPLRWWLSRRRLEPFDLP